MGKTGGGLAFRVLMKRSVLVSPGFGSLTLAAAEAAAAGDTDPGGGAVELSDVPPPIIKGEFTCLK